MNKLTQPHLKELLHYDPETGVFTWKERDVSTFNSVFAWEAWNPRFAGTVAGANKNGYRVISVNSAPHSLHRLAFLYMDGSEPPDGVDHINGDKADNRWANLRAVSGWENQKNRALNKNNRSGVPGVRKRSGKWDVTIGKEYLGRFPSKNDAIKVRKAAEKANNYHPNHGRGIVAL